MPYSARNRLSLTVIVLIAACGVAIILASCTATLPNEGDPSSQDPVTPKHGSTGKTLPPLECMLADPTVVDGAAGDDNDDVGLFSAIGVDSTGVVHIAYWDWTNRNLKVVSKDSDGWNVTVVDREGAVGRYPSLAIDANDHIHVAYLDGSNYHLKVATNVTGSWATSAISTRPKTGKHASMVIDNRGKYHIVYLTEHPPGPVTSIAIDPNGIPHIAYYDAKAYKPIVAHKRADEWVHVTLDDEAIDVGSYRSVAFDSSGAMHMIYYDEYNKRLKHLAQCPR